LLADQPADPDDDVGDAEILDDNPAEAGRDVTESVILADEAIEDGQDDDDTSEQSEIRRHRALMDWAVVIVVALLVAFLGRTFVLAHFVVDGPSMLSTLHDGDRVLVNKLSCRLHDSNRGDVVVLHQSAGASGRDLIKRVIALPGETIEVRRCEVLIDGQTLDEPYLDREVVTPGNCGSDLAAVRVPEDHVLVMGDNRGGSQDSRSPALGSIDEDDLVGRAFVVFWPPGHWQWL